MNEEGKMLAAKYGYLDGHKHAKINITNKKLHKKLTVSPNQTRLI